MRIFFNKKTKKIIGTVDGFSDDPTLDKMTIIPRGVKEQDIGKENICLRHPLELAARMFEDTRHPARPLNYKIKMNKKGEIEKFMPL